MGICSSTTKQNVQDDLESSLLAKAKAKLSADFQKTLSSDPTLSDYLEAIAKDGFNTEFSYDWSLTNCSPPANVGTVISVYDYCIVDQDHNLVDSINTYVKQALSSADLSSWMKVNATADLATAICDIANDPCDNDWHYKPWTETYNASDTNTSSYRADMEIVYTNATRTESVIDVTLHIFYFVGVYYTINSPTQKAFGDLQKDTYTAAEKLANVTATVTDDPSLTTALSQFSIPTFKSKWDYDFQSGKPSDYAQGESDALYTKNTQLCYFQSKSKVLDDDDDFLDKYIKTHIMDGLNIPIDSARESIQNDLKASFRDIISSANSGEWNTEYIDKDYELDKASADPLRMNALMVPWYDSKSVDVVDTDGKTQNITVEIIYLYFLAVVYEVITGRIAQDLTQALSKYIPQVETPLPTNITPDKFTTYVETYNASKFKDEYDIDFPNAASTKGEKHWKPFFEFPSWDPSEDDIKKAVTLQLFGRDTTDGEEIKHGLQAKVYDFIVDHIKDYSGSDTVKDDNQWYNETKENDYPYTTSDNTNCTLSVRTSWAFANGKITEDGQGGTTIERFYLSLLLYITAEKDPDSDLDV